MIQQQFYCSELSQGSGEQIFGTASTGEVWLLLEYPSAWGSKPLEESALPAAVKSRLASLLKTIPRSRILFVKQQSRRGEFLSLFVVRAREQSQHATQLKLKQYKDLLDFDLAAIAAGDAAAGGERVLDPLFLVCTHGRRDKCCAKYGYPLYKRMREGTAGANVWQSSHVGGDRFAANMVCFPHGLYYARVDAESGARIVEEYGRSRIVLENYRGRVCYSNQLQAAEFFARRESGLAGLADLFHAGGARLGEKIWRFRFSAPGAGMIYEAQVACRPSEFRNFITCQSPTEKGVDQFVLEDFHTAVDPAHAHG